jgi:hypothetical protein
MKYFEVSSIFHAELDQLLFRTDQLSLKIASLNKNGLHTLSPRKHGLRFSILLQ